jgi:hypothetical protein
LRRYTEAIGKYQAAPDVIRSGKWPYNYVNQ